MLAKGDGPLKESTIKIKKFPPNIFKQKFKDDRLRVKWWQYELSNKLNNSNAFAFDGYLINPYEIIGGSMNLSRLQKNSPCSKNPI